MKINVGILLFNDVEILDFTGPYEVFGSTRVTKKKLNKKNIKEIYKTECPFYIFTVSEKFRTIMTNSGMQVKCDFRISNSPRIDILLLPGGLGTRKLLKNKKVLSWIRTQENNSLLVSVCTGSLLLAAAGLLINKKAATHWSASDLLKKISPSTKVSKKRFVLDTIYSSSGVSAGIDLSLKIVEKYFGNQVLKNTLKYMEYKLF